MPRKSSATGFSVGRIPTATMLATEPAPSSSSIYDDEFRFKAVYTITVNYDSVTGNWFNSNELTATKSNLAYRTGTFYASKLDGGTDPKTWRPNDELNVNPVIYKYDRTTDNNEYTASSSYYFSGFTLKVFKPKAKVFPSVRDMPLVSPSTDFPPFSTRPDQFLLFSQEILTDKSFSASTPLAIAGVKTAYGLNTISSDDSTPGFKVWQEQW